MVGGQVEGDGRELLLSVWEMGREDWKGGRRLNKSLTNEYQYTTAAETISRRGLAGVEVVCKRLRLR